MRDKTINKLILIQENIKKLNIKSEILPQIICISKTFGLSQISPLIDYGHIHFGENKVQEAEQKWLDLRNKNKKIKLHMVGRLQTNKVKKAVQILKKGQLTMDLSIQEEYFEVGQFTDASQTDLIVVLRINKTMLEIEYAKYMELVEPIL